MNENKTSYFIFMVSLIATVLCSAVSAQEEGLNTPESVAAMEKVLKDYIDLYRRETLQEWKELFHPSATIMFPADDGTIAVRSVEEFYIRQRNFFAGASSVSERLENVRIATGRRMSRVVADFIFVIDGQERRGKLGLHLLEEGGKWKITAVVFSYNQQSRIE